MKLKFAVLRIPQSEDGPGENLIASLKPKPVLFRQNAQPVWLRSNLTIRLAGDGQFFIGANYKGLQSGISTGNPAAVGLRNLRTGIYLAPQDTASAFIFIELNTRVKADMAANMRVL